MPITGPCYYAVMPNHTHPAYSFVYAFNDYCRIKIGDRIKRSIHGKVCAISPGVVHQELESELSPRYIAVFISAEYFDKQLEYYEVGANLCFQGEYYPANGNITRHMTEYLNEYEVAGPGYQKLLEANGLKITHSLIRMIYGTKPKDQNFTDRISVNKVISFMHAHYGQRLTVADMATVACVSASHFARLFRTETGAAPMEYLHRIRLNIAKRMLRTGDTSLTQIALKCGFNSSSYFSTCFSRSFNMTPSEFRKSFNKIES
jgi:AraC family transcriptional regulator